MASDEQRRVLVVDDDEAILKLIGRVLNELHVASDVARNGVEALRCLASSKYDIAIIDLVMPEFDGMQLLDKIRELMIDPPVIVVLTAHSREFRHRLDGSIVNMVVRKPFDAKELAAIVLNCLEAAPRRGEESRSVG